jgi:hypothetical protein
MTKKTRNWLIALAILAFPFVLFSIFFFSRLVEIPTPPPPLPNPNGYNDLVKAGTMLVDNTGDFNETNATQVRKIVSANAAALVLARAGLSNQCRVPVQYSLSYISNHLDELTGLKRLARTFVAEGILAEMENRPADAAKSYLDTIHLANESCCGGLLIDELISIAIEAIGTAHMRTLVPHLDVGACRETVASLAALDSQAPNWDEIMQQESAWSQAALHDWRYEFMRGKMRKSTASVIAVAKEKFNEQDQKTRQLMISLAARAYELDKGHPPAGAADLVPEYLKAVPQDPATGTNMVYSPR